ncbi:MAG: tripartite tricarboxylate transporter substrate binding protein [Burkholderiaceae bacterium]
MRRIFSLPLLIMALAVVTPAQADNYPEKQIRMLVPASTGGAADTLARLVSRHLGDRLGQPVIVENKPGGAAILGMTMLANAPADGYTIGLTFAGAMSINPSMYRNLSYDPVNSYDPVALLAISPLVLTVNNQLGVSTLAELLDMARKNPGKLTFGSAGTGSTQHLSMELLKSVAGVDMMHVPYKGSAGAVIDVQSGVLSMLNENAITVMPHILNGRMTALAVGTQKRITPLPDVPTIAESGFPGYTAAGWYGMVVPKGVDPAIVKRLNSIVNDIISQPEVQETLQKQGMEPAIETAEAFGQYIQQERDKWARVIQSAKVPLQDLR